MWQVAKGCTLQVHELDQDYYPQWHNFFDAMLVMLNIGLYTYYNTSVFSTDRRVLVEAGAASRVPQTTLWSASPCPSRR